MDVTWFGGVLAEIKQIKVLDWAARWPVLREIRNAINHGYEENSNRRSQF